CYRERVERIGWLRARKAEEGGEIAARPESPKRGGYVRMRSVSCRCARGVADRERVGVRTRKAVGYQDADDPIVSAQRSRVGGKAKAAGQRTRSERRDDAVVNASGRAVSPAAKAVQRIIDWRVVDRQHDFIREHRATHKCRQKHYLQDRQKDSVHAG